MRIRAQCGASWNFSAGTQVLDPGTVPAPALDVEPKPKDARVMPNLRKHLLPHP